ncbi:hypothetical protein BB561_004940 [Smittium simulii]|uniref:phosphoserine phosphatase n=1 Tax=Smittium simulii TaxID=133385 RepID=A0A2T9YD72_9FUNG|nr:hypothetical protein BB561_004940 [Smittium simulii]
MRFLEYYEKELVSFPSDWAQHFLKYAELRTFIENSIDCSTVDLLRSFPKGFTFSWELNSSTISESEKCELPLNSTNKAREFELRGQNEVCCDSFEQLLSTRLSALSLNAPSFIKNLDQSILSVNVWYNSTAQDVIKNAESLFPTLQQTLEKSTKQDSVDNFSKKEYESLENILKTLYVLEEFLIINFIAIFKILKRFDKHSGLRIRGPYVMRLTNLFGSTSKAILKIKTKATFYLKIISQASTFDSTQAKKEILSNSKKDNSPNQEYLQKHLNTVFNNSANSDTEAIHQLINGNNESISSDLASFNSKSCKTKDGEHHIAVSLRGPHGTDIIGGILECCSNYECRILDFSLSRLHHDVVFGVFLAISGKFIDLYNDLVRTARIWDGELTFDVQSSSLQLKQVANGCQYRLEEAPYINRSKYVATVLSQTGLCNVFLDKFLKWLLLKKISVEKMKRLDQSADLKCIEFLLSVPHEINSNDLVQEIIIFSTQYKTDIALQPHNVFWRQKRLVVFDMDSTLIQQEVIDEIARHSGIVDQVSEITELAMQGKIDFKESLARRVGLLKGTPTSVLEKVQKSLTFTDGAHELCKALKAAGFKLAVISGGFIPLAKYVKNQLGLDYAFANQLETTSDGEFLTGKTVGAVVDAERKAELLEVIAQAERISLSQVAAVGDGANDLKMLARASLGIAFNAKSKVQEQAKVRINQSSLINVLYLMGYSEKEAVELQNAVYQ